jgi:hypothetical protein
MLMLMGTILYQVAKRALNDAEDPSYGANIQAGCCPCLTS